jgi:acyl-homoserine lactone acylase PvdQ
LSTRLAALGAVIALLAAVPAAVGASRDYAAVALNVLPPGEAGLEGGPHATDQARLYDKLTPHWNAVSESDLGKYYKAESFGLTGKPVRVEQTGRQGLKIVRDSWGVAHITGKTRDDVMFGDGWVTGEDRNLLLQLIRGPARIAALDVPGLNAFSLALSGKVFQPSDAAEQQLSAQLQLLQGPKGARILKDVDAFDAGLNAYIKSSGLDIKPWTRNDVIAAGSLIAGIFGIGGGDEVRRAEFLSALQQKFGADKGYAIWNDLRQVEVPGSPVSIDASFPFGQPPASHPGNVVVDDGSFQPWQYCVPTSGVVCPSLKGLARRTPASMSNGLLVSAKRSSSGHPIFVAGPQVGYYWPEFFLELDLHGGGIDTRGAVFPGLPWVVIGRAKDYAWSAQSSHSDIVDQFVETLCGGDDFHYMYKGECRAMGTFDAGQLTGGGAPAEELIFRTTVHGPVVGYAKVNGTRVAISSDRSTRGHEILSTEAFSDLNSNKVHSAQDFFKVMNQEEFSFNWVYADNKDIAFFSAARLPIRAPGVDIGLPTIGTGEYDWQGFAPLSAHARGINPKSGVIAAWNNRPAKDYAAPDDQWSWGQVERVQLLQSALAAKKKHTPASVVAAMNQAATQDLRAVQVWPAIATMLGKGTAPSARDAQMVALLNSWRSRGASRLDGDLDGKIDDPGAAIMDAAWPKIADAVMSPVLGQTLTDRLSMLIPRDDPPNSQGSAFDSGWYSYVQKDLSYYPLTYCGHGDQAACSASLWAAIDAAGNELQAAQGPDPSLWRADATAERIHFAPGLTHETMRWTNRPTFQQVIMFRGHRPR